MQPRLCASTCLDAKWDRPNGTEYSIGNEREEEEAKAEVEIEREEEVRHEIEVERVMEQNAAS